MVIQLNSIPKSIGVYLYYDNNGCLLYIGKSKNIRKRVTCFLYTNDNYKHNIIVKHIKKIKWFLTKNEYEALLLEMKLIKKLKPLYNIKLRDDKEYPYICILKEKYPRIIITKKLYKVNKYIVCYGPYLYIKVAKILLDFIKYLYPIRSCDLSLTDQKINLGSYNKCIQFDMNKCKGPCIGLQSEINYMKNIFRIKNILSNDISNILYLMYFHMKIFIKNLNFEYASLLNNHIIILKKYAYKLKKTNPKSIIL